MGPADPQGQLRSPDVDPPWAYRVYTFPPPNIAHFLNIPGINKRSQHCNLLPCRKRSAALYFSVYIQDACGITKVS
jgi:hypothetical protein